MARTDKKATEQAASAVVSQPQQAAQLEQAQTNAVATIRGLLEARQGELAAGLRTFGIDPERFKSVALSQFSRNPDLWRCEPLSVYRAMKEAADYGLEPTGSIGGAHLVPYGSQCTLLIDYRGLVRMVRRSGEVVRVEARVVRQQDQFVYRYGLEPTLEHVPALVPDPGDLAYVYAVLIFKDGDRQFDVMSKAEVEAIRGRSRAGRSGPWVTDYFEMAKKTVLRRACKLAPLDDLTRTALAREDEREGEAQQLTRVATVLDRQSQLRGQLAAQLVPQLGQAAAEQVAAQVDPAVLEGVAEVTSAEWHGPPPAVPTSDVAGRPLTPEQQATSGLREGDTWTDGRPAAEPPVPGQITLEQAEVAVNANPQLVDEPPPPVDNPSPKTRPTVDAAPAQRPVCGATVAGPDSTTYTCSLAVGHRGDHTDGQHDWPQQR